MFHKIKPANLEKSVTACIFTDTDEEITNPQKEFIQLIISGIKDVGENCEEELIKTPLEAFIKNTILNNVHHVKRLPKTSSSFRDRESQRIHDILINDSEDYREKTNKTKKGGIKKISTTSQQQQQPQLFRNNDNIGLKVPPDQLQILKSLILNEEKSLSSDDYIELGLSYYNNREKSRKFCTKIAKDIYHLYGKVQILPHVYDIATADTTTTTTTTT